MTKEFVCIVCPSSCRLTVEELGDGQYKVSGNTCKRGVDHGIREYTNPQRMLTTTVAISGAELPRLPVISSGELPKAKLCQCLDELYQTVVTAPITSGQVILHNICGTGVDICASRTMNRKGE